MRKLKRDRLKKTGWRVGTVAEFLDLTPEESIYIELKIRLGENLRMRRVRRKMTQVDLARKIESSQSRVAKMERGDSSVSIDLLIRSLLALGTSNRELGKIVATT